MRSIGNKKQYVDKYSNWNILDCVDFSEKYTRVSKGEENRPLVFVEYIDIAHENKIGIFKWLKSIIRTK